MYKKTQKLRLKNRIDVQMMEIIKPGHKKFKTTCDRCGCEFTYTKNDICYSDIHCPECGNYIVHKLENAID